MIKKWFNENFGRTRTILFDESDLKTMINIMDGSAVDHFHIGNCGWAKAPYCWFVEFQALEGTYWKVVRKMVQKNIEMFPDTTGF